MLWFQILYHNTVCIGLDGNPFFLHVCLLTPPSKLLQCSNSKILFITSSFLISNKTLCLDKRKWREIKGREMKGLHFPDLDANRGREVNRRNSFIILTKQIFLGKIWKESTPISPLSSFPPSFSFQKCYQTT